MEMSTRAGCAEPSYRTRNDKESKFSRKQPASGKQEPAVIFASLQGCLSLRVAITMSHVTRLKQQMSLAGRFSVQQSQILEQ